MSDIITDLRDCADNVDNEYPGAASVMRRAADHLASSGPAGEIDVIKHLEEQNHRFATDMENQDDVIEKLKQECEAMKEKWHTSIVAFEQCKALMYKTAEERDDARDECEAQKARAIRAEGDRDDAEAQCASAERELNDLDLSTTAEIARLGDALREIIAVRDAYPADVFREPDWEKVNQVLSNAGIMLDSISGSNMRHVAERVAAIARQALTPAPDHAKGEVDGG